ncbi:MAG: hypothetical protein ACI3YZ_02855 [Prevotella sp.]
MKKLFATFALVMLAVAGYAQSQNLEPEFIGQVVLINADSTATPLQKEIAKFKTNSSKWGWIPVPGAALLDKSKCNIVVKGTESPTKLKGGRLTFIIRAEKNDADPRTVFGVFMFEVKKKTREFQMAQAGLLSGVESTTNFNTVETKVEKYGDHSYKVTIENAKPGQYGIATDFVNIATFGVE